MSFYHDLGWTQEIVELAQSYDKEIEEIDDRIVTDLLRIGQIYWDIRRHVPYEEFLTWAKEMHGRRETQANNLCRAFQRFSENPELISGYSNASVIFELIPLSDDAIALVPPQAKTEQVRSLKRVHNFILKKIQNDNPICQSEWQKEAYARAIELGGSEQDFLNAVAEVSGVEVVLPQRKPRQATRYTYKQFEEMQEDYRRAMRVVDDIKREADEIRFQAKKLELELALQQQLTRELEEKLQQQQAPVTPDGRVLEEVKITPDRRVLEEAEAPDPTVVKRLQEELRQYKERFGEIGGDLAILDSAGSQLAKAKKPREDFVENLRKLKEVVEGGQALCGMRVYKKNKPNVVGEITECKSCSQTLVTWWGSAFAVPEQLVLLAWDEFAQTSALVPGDEIYIRSSGEIKTVEKLMPHGSILTVCGAIVDQDDWEITF